MVKSRGLLLVAGLLTSLLLSSPAWSYVGPGVGITMLGAFWAVISFCGVLFAGMLVWPIRSFFRRRRKNKQSDLTEN